MTNNKNIQKKEERRLAFADGLRGLAALWVVFFHMSEGGHIPQLKSAVPHVFAVVLFDWGHFGVPVFFVLSGFVMALTVSEIAFDRCSAFRFVIRRLVRLSPPYYFAIGVALGFGWLKAFALGGSVPEISFTDVISHLGYAQLLSTSPVINTVFWTLVIEVQFYIAFSVFLYCSDALTMHRGRFFLFGLVGALALLWPFGVVTIDVWHGSFMQYWYAFLVGVFVCWGGYGSIQAKYFGVLYCLVVLGIGVATSSGFALTVALTGISLLIAIAARKEGKWLACSSIQFLALVSYSLYLIHNPLTGATFRLAKIASLTSAIGEAIAAAIALLVCLTGSWLAYRFIERPSIEWSHFVRVKTNCSTS